MWCHTGAAGLGVSWLLGAHACLGLVEPGGRCISSPLEPGRALSNGLSAWAFGARSLGFQESRAGALRPSPWEPGMGADNGFGVSLGPLGARPWARRAEQGAASPREPGQFERRLFGAWEPLGPPCLGWGRCGVLGLRKIDLAEENFSAAGSRPHDILLRMNTTSFLPSRPLLFGLLRGGNGRLLQGDGVLTDRVARAGVVLAPLNSSPERQGGGLSRLVCWATVALECPSSAV